MSRSLQQYTRKEMGRLIALWAALFVATLFVNGLDARSLVAAFLAWLGGLVTAEIVNNRNNIEKKKEAPSRGHHVAGEQRAA